MNLQVGDLVRNKARPELGTGEVAGISSRDDLTAVIWENYSVPRSGNSMMLHHVGNLVRIEAWTLSDRVSLTSFGRAFHHIGCIAEDAAAE